MPSDRLISQRLQYNAKTPAFLLALQGKVSGKTVNEDEDDAEDPEMEQLDVNRPAIPRRPRGLVAEDQAQDRGDDDAESGDEKPMVVVLREGKHLTERQAENERRKGMCWPCFSPTTTLVSYIAPLAQGLAPLPELENKNDELKSARPSLGATTSPSHKSSTRTEPLSFSSSAKGSSTGQRSANVHRLKRKASVPQDEKASKDLEKSKKKKKKESKSLVSFGDE